MFKMFKSKFEQKMVCRKCKTVYLSTDGSPCPKCSKVNRELAAKRKRNKEAATSSNKGE